MEFVSGHRMSTRMLEKSSYTTSRSQELKETLTNAKFFSLLLDGSTDTGIIDDEAFLVVWCDHNGSDEKVHTRMSYFTVVQPQAVTARGLFEALESGLQALVSMKSQQRACWHRHRWCSCKHSSTWIERSG